MSTRGGRGPKAVAPTAAWDPIRELAGLKDRLNRLFETALRRGGEAGAEGFGGWSPVADLREERDLFVLTAELPGVGREDLKLRVEGRSVTLEGARPSGREPKGAVHLHVERFYGPFVRTFHLPAAVDETGVRARLASGVLEVRLPKATRERSAAVRIRIA